MAAEEVTRVVHRCEQANEDGKLDLSRCLLTSFPDAVFHLTRQATVESCDLSHNELKKLTLKFAKKFTLLTVLDLSANKLESLPENLDQLTSLRKLDASNNCLRVFPVSVVSNLPKIEELNLQNNRISDVDSQSLVSASGNSLVDINLEMNPLSTETRIILQNVSDVNIKISEPDDDYNSLD
ncbi:leucine-rich repeat-containing protein 40-like [Asterias rubens]|uniref:leucine-rich repeat-containing protein 40-like n=1 Tax=Asterias rubens TaxID=7604 RepID=UPI0014557594|nr:leucine-rich repeat-containing protein 40-like [Asterias rubens]